MLLICEIVSNEFFFFSKNIQWDFKTSAIGDMKKRQHSDTIFPYLNGYEYHSYMLEEIHWQSFTFVICCRKRLHGLFAQIEKEFETLYAENLACK